MIGEKLGSFRVEAVLGTGAMGVVYRAVHETLGKTAAVKVISSELAQKNKTYERFRREAEILQQFRHPNIVRFFAVGRYQGTSYIAMEFVQGGTLEQILAERGPLPWREVVDLGIQICDALHYAHQHGVVHRDLKPSNLMISERGQIKLTDFGIAKDLDATALTATGRTLGTAAYMAPEQVRGTPAVSHKTDLYALGVVLYQMLTGRAPFEGTSAVVLMHCHLNEPPPRPSAKVAEIPVALDELVVKLMAKAPADRPWDAVAVNVVLTELRDKALRDEPIPMVWSGPGGKGGPPTRTTEGSKKSKKAGKGRGRASLPVPDRSALTTAALVLALVLVGGVIAWGVWPPSQDYLYRQAKDLMASKDRHDWERARDEYIDPLDRRFPQNPYHEETQAWRDRILVAQAEGRAKTLSSAVRTLLSEPKNKGELQYAATYKLADEASQRGDDLAAMRQWAGMAELLDEKDPEERPWVLFARKRVDDLKKAIQDRREVVISLLQRALTAEGTGDAVEADRIRKQVLKDYGRYTDLTDLLGTPPAPAGNPQAPPAHDQPKPAASTR